MCEGKKCTTLVQDVESGRGGLCGVGWGWEDGISHSILL